MKKTRVLLVACALSLPLAACGDSSPTVMAPEGARYSAGAGIQSDTTTVGASSIDRGGSTIGSGN